MAWKIRYLDNAERQLRKLDRSTRERVLDFMENRIASFDDPRRRGKPLSGRLKNLWRYRVGDIRVICAMEDDEMVVLVVSIGHRREVYR